MKKLIFILISILLAVPTLADDLKPEPSDQAIKEYLDFWKTGSIDPSNHVVWKLYVFRSVPPSATPSASPVYIVAGLTTYSRSSYYIGLRINQLYNYLHPIPKRGDVIVVSGRIIGFRNGPVVLPDKTRIVKTLTLEVDGAVNLPEEHFDPMARIPIARDYGSTTTPASDPTPISK